MNISALLSYLENRLESIETRRPHSIWEYDDPVELVGRAKEIRNIIDVIHNSP